MTSLAIMTARHVRHPRAEEEFIVFVLSLFLLVMFFLVSVLFFGFFCLRFLY